MPLSRFCPLPALPPPTTTHQTWVGVWSVVAYHPIMVGGGLSHLSHLSSPSHHHPPDAVPLQAARGEGSAGDTDGDGGAAAGNLAAPLDAAPAASRRATRAASPAAADADGTLGGSPRSRRHRQQEGPPVPVPPKKARRRAADAGGSGATGPAQPGIRGESTGELEAGGVGLARGKRAVGVGLATRRGKRAAESVRELGEG
jgi:hypothetical protein